LLFGQNCAHFIWSDTISSIEIMYHAQIEPNGTAEGTLVRTRRNWFRLKKVTQRIRHTKQKPITIISSFGRFWSIVFITEWRRDNSFSQVAILFLVRLSSPTFTIVCRREVIFPDCAFLMGEFYQAVTLHGLVMISWNLCRIVEIVEREKPCKGTCDCSEIFKVRFFSL
jgi:hypothetical protein